MTNIATPAASVRTAPPPPRTVLRPTPLAPVTLDGKVPDQRGVAAIIFRNAGTATVELWKGLYTLDAKETLSLNVTEPNAVMDITDMEVYFDTTTGAVKKLQIVVLRPANC